MTSQEAYLSIFNLLWNKNPAHRNKDALNEIKAILKQVYNQGLEDAIHVLKESRTFGIEEEVNKINQLKEKI